MRRLREHRSLLRLLGVLGVLVGLGGGYAIYAAASATLPPPTFTAKPASSTLARTATFRFVERAHGHRRPPPVTFQCSFAHAWFKHCASPARFSNLAFGWHTFRVRARRVGKSELSRAATYRWFVKRPPLPTPQITSYPSNPTTSTTATFAFVDSRAGVMFRCRLDGGTWSACSSPAAYSGLGVGQHMFSVLAFDRAGQKSAVASYTFAVTPPVAGSGEPFTITGDAVGSLYPGAAATALAVKLSNPNSVPIYVTGMTATLESSGLPNGCAPSNFTIAQASIPAAGVEVPANGSVTLPTEGATAPSIQMIETGTNQDACEAATLTIGYSGSAHS